MSNELDGIAKTMLDAGRALQATLTPVTPQDVVVAPPGYQVVPTERLIEPFLEAPRRIKECARMDTLAGFIRYVQMFRDPRTKVWGQFDPQSGSVHFLGVMDYHLEAGRASWCSHLVRYSPRMSVEWQNLMGYVNTDLDQEALTRFVEEHQRLIVEPPVAELLDVVMNLEGKNDIRCNSMIRLGSGKCRLLYEEDVTLKGVSSTTQGEVDFPQELALAVAPYEFGTWYQFKARVRYRLHNRRLFFRLEPVDIHLILEEAVNGMLAAVEGELTTQVLRGMPSCPGALA